MEDDLSYGDRPQKQVIILLMVTALSYTCNVYGASSEESEFVADQLLPESKSTAVSREILQ